MLKREQGFSLIELLVAMVVFIVVIAASSNIFIRLLTEFKQQSKIAETTVQEVVGLEVMRRDIEHAGYGLPWTIPAGASYADATSPAIWSSASDAPSNPPRGIVSGDNLSSGSSFPVGGSDYLVIKSMNVATNTVAGNWALLANTGVLRNGLSGRAFAGTDNVMVINPGSTSASQRSLVLNSSNNWNATYGSLAGFAPTGTGTNIVYGVDPSAAARPFNRADYYISNLSSTAGLSVPSRCAPGTGVLVKALVAQDAAGTLTELPLLDCVADLQVVYALDNDQDGDFVVGTGTPADAYANNLSGLSAQDVRDRVKEVRVYILSHEGQRDPNYTYPAGSIIVGMSSTLGRTFYLTTITNWQNYRWKLHTLVVRTENL